MKKWIKWKYNQKIEIEQKEIILNSYKGPKRILINALILIMKRYIYVTKCKQERPNYVDFMVFIQRIIQIEYLTALQNDKVKKHVKKWSNFLDKL